MRGRLVPKTVAWLAAWTLLAVVAAAAGMHVWTLPDGFWSDGTGHAAHLGAAEWGRIGMTTSVAAMVFAPGAFALLTSRPGRNGAGGAGGAGGFAG